MPDCSGARDTVDSIHKELRGLITEKSNSDSKSLGKLSTKRILDKINSEDKKVPIAVGKEIPRIAVAVDLIVARMKEHGRLIYVGAGTSGRLGVIDAAELLPTFGVGPELVRALIAGGKEAMFQPIEGAEDEEGTSVRDLKIIDVNSKDVVLGISASGRTPYVSGALKYAREVGAETIALTVNPNSMISKLAKIVMCPVTGPEIIAGSTRMKAGTAQKLVLNMISTCVMIKMGKVHDNLMVDLKPVSRKLVERQKRIVMEALVVPYSESERILERAKGNVKLAVLMGKTGIKYENAKKLLEQSEDSLERALHGSTLS